MTRKFYASTLKWSRRNPMLSDPQDVIMSAHPGTVIYARVDVGAGMETALFLREESERIQALGPGPRIEIRAALLIEDGVALIPILVRLGPKAKDIFETWLNIHQTGGGMHYLQDLATQPRILVILYGDHGRERAIESINLLKSTFADILVRVAGLPPWTMREFDQARERVYRRYPTPKELWWGLDK